MNVKKAYISHTGCPRMELTLPSGKSIVITQSEPYVTLDPDELDFLAQQRWVALADPDAKEVQHSLFNIENLPSVVKSISKDSNYANYYKVNTEEQYQLRNALKGLGYGHKEPGMPLIKSAIDILNANDMKQKLEEMGYTVTEPEVKPDVTHIDAPDPLEDACDVLDPCIKRTREELEGMMWSSLQKLASYNGVSPFGKKKADIVKELLEKGV